MTTKSKHTSAVWGSLIELVSAHKKRFLLVVFISLLSTVTSLVEPLIYREAINDVAGLFVHKAKVEAAHGHTVANDDEPISSFFEKEVASIRKEPHRPDHVAPRTPSQAMNTLAWAVVLLFAVNLIGQLFNLLSENLNVRLACNIERSFIQRTFSHVLKQPLSFFNKRSSASLAKQINQSEEVSAIVDGFSQKILPDLISLIGILIIMFTQNVTLTLISIAIIPFYLLVAWRSANKLDSGLSEYYERWEEVSARIQDALVGIKTVKLSGAENREVIKLNEIADSAYGDYVDRTRKANGYIFWETMLTQVSTAMVLGYGGYLTLQNQLTPGDVVMFVAYLDRLYDPIDSLSSLWVNLQQNVASVARAFKLLHVGKEEKHGSKLSITHGQVEYRNIIFGYTTKREILKDISFIASPGKVTALVGTSGAGKTTTIDLLLKLYNLRSGSILIDGQNLAKLDAASVREQIGIVSADGAIFRGTLADNIRYKAPNATDAEVQKAAAGAGLETTLARLTDGLQTVVGESGVGLSVGERQRIQIARVLVSHPRILVLDEATANLDFATEAEIKRTIDIIRKENTVIIVAHRYSMVKDADHVVVLDHGEIKEEGSVEELIEKGGWFSDFAKSADQF
jgi:ATP-binding cassette, subfamily B, bacterial